MPPARSVVANLLLAALASSSAPLAAQQTVRDQDWNWRLRDLSGNDVRFADYRGEVLFVNLWATWCRPCVAELASIERLARSLDGQPVRFLVVSPEPLPRVRRFLAGNRYDLPVFVEVTRMPRAFGMLGLPTTYIIDREGRVVLRRQGAAAWDAEPVRDLLGALARSPRSVYNSTEDPGPRP